MRHKITGKLPAWTSRPIFWLIRPALTPSAVSSTEVADRKKNWCGR
jgi:hypothetical protein